VVERAVPLSQGARASGNFDAGSRELARKEQRALHEPVVHLRAITTRRKKMIKKRNKPMGKY
jgi:hypothetical protein